MTAPNPRTPIMTSGEVERLREAAERATPGPWSVVHVSLRSLIYTADCSRHLAMTDEYHDPRDGAPDHEDRKANATFIALANPQAVLALLTENARLREGLERIKTADVRLNDGGPSPQYYDGFRHGVDHSRHIAAQALTDRGDTSHER